MEMTLDCHWAIFQPYSRFGLHHCPATSGPWRWHWIVIGLSSSHIHSLVHIIALPPVVHEDDIELSLGYLPALFKVWPASLPCHQWSMEMTLDCHWAIFQPYSRFGPHHCPATSGPWRWHWIVIGLSSSLFQGLAHIIALPPVVHGNDIGLSLGYLPATFKVWPTSLPCHQWSVEMTLDCYWAVFQLHSQFGPHHCPATSGPWRWHWIVIGLSSSLIQGLAHIIALPPVVHGDDIGLPLGYLPALFNVWPTSLPCHQWSMGETKDCH